MRLLGLDFAAGTSWRRTAAGLAVGWLSASLCAQGLVTPLTLTDAYEAAVRHGARDQLATKEQEAARQGVPLAQPARRVQPQAATQPRRRWQRPDCCPRSGFF